MRRLVLALVGTYFAVLVIAQLPASRHITGDVVPGRYGALVLRCGGGFDLARVAWIAALDRDGKLPYWAHHDRDGHVVSTFGPAPAVVASLTMLDVSPGTTLDDESLRARERFAAAFLIAIATTLMVLAAAARRDLRTSIAIGALAAASYAGMATLGQALWQQTVALPFLVGALATLAWRDRRPGVLVVTPALLAIAVAIRPALAPIVVGLAMLWVLARPRYRAIAIAAAVVVIVPFVMWNVAHLGSPLPLGQATANAALTDQTFVLSRAQLGAGVGGLLVSPARGLLWFAPIVILGVVHAFRAREQRVLAGALIVQLVMMGLFYRWWGGVAFGPRLLAEVTWVGIWLALASPLSLTHRRLVGCAIGVTVIVGQLGLWCWRAEQWETRRTPDIDPNALWDPSDSPIPSTLRSFDDQLFAHDAPTAPLVLHCARDGID